MEAAGRYVTLAHWSSNASSHVFCVEYPRIEQRIVKGEGKRNKRSNLESFLLKKIASVKYRMQELKLNYPTAKKRNDTSSAASTTTE
jgi:hypothetical protein